MSLADYSTIHPDLFGSPSKTLLSQSSYSSGDTGDFMCEASEQCSFYSPPFSTLIATGGSIPSEDEVSVSFESHHSLLDVRSPLDRKEREGQIHSDSSSGVSDEERTKKTAPIKRQRRVESFGENTVHSVDEVLTPPPVAPVVGESNRQPKVDSLLERSPVRDDTTATPANNSQDDSNSSPDTPRRRARRHAVASCPPPIDVQQLIERRASQETDYPKEETVTTPRQRKTYTIEARLQNPLNLQLQREETAAVVDDIEESTPCGEEEDAPVVSQPDLGFDDDVCPNPPTSPHLPGSSVSVGYSHQSQLDGIRIPAESGRGFGGSGGDGDVSTEEEEEEEGGVVGNSTSSNIEAIENLLAKYPLLSGYSTSSLLAMTSYTSRKMSDSAVIMRNNCSTNSHPHQRHRCVSDSAAPHIIVDDDKNSEVGSSSHNYCDSGYNDEKSSRCHGSSSSAYIPSPRVSLHSSDLLSQEEGLDGGGSSSLSHSKQHRRLTPYMSGNIVCSSVSTSQSKEDTVPTSQEIELGGPAVISSPLGGASGGTMVRPRERSKRSQTKNYSQSSIGASSIGTGASSETISLTSLFETPSPLTVEDMLSNLGFDDFMSPQLIPDRFIPREIEHAKPSIMRTMTLSEYTTHDSPSNSHHSSYEPSIASTSYSAPLPYSHHHTSHSQHHQFHSSSSSISLPGAYTYTGASSEPKTEETAAQTSHTYKIAKDSNIGDLPLGATAENFLAPRSSSPPPPAQSSQQQPEREAPTRNNDARFLNSSNLVTVGFHRGRLETVPEETASDLSPSPRWLSPRVSIDHSVNFDVAEGKLGASLNVQKVRKRSLPTQREGYRLSVGSLVESDTGGDSIHFSVTSYDDEIAAEREKEREDTLPHLSLEDISIHQQRRRRRGVYTPPPALLTWLTQQQPIHEEDVGDPDELPWPFNEQARLRKSLTDIQLAQMALDGSTDVPSDLVNESQFSGSSGKAEGCSSLSSSPPSSIPRSSPGPGEEEENIVPATPRLSNNLSPLRRRHSRDNSTASLSRARANHKTRSLSCQSDYHILRRHLEVPHNPFTNINNGPLGEQDDLLRNEMIEELRYTMSTSQRRLSHALALKGEQCRQLQEVPNQT